MLAKNITASDQLQSNTKNYLLHGIAASLLLTVLYFLIVSLAESFNHATTQFISLSYLIVPLVAGFGVQVSLFSYSHQLSKAMGHGTVSVTGSGGVSTVSMIACCLHHVTDVLPILGLTAAGIFLTTYQSSLILIGVFSNVIGIIVILMVMQKHKLYNPNGLLAKPMKYNLRKVRNIIFVLSLIVIVLSFAWIGVNSQPAPISNEGTSTPSPTPRVTSNPPIVQQNNTAFSLSPKLEAKNGLEVQVIPFPFSAGGQLKFKLAFDTHGGDLSFDVKKIAFLEDSNGVKYLPISWDGSPAGGHHREGTLTFPPFTGQPSSIKLVLTNVYAADWSFEWRIDQ